MSTSLTSYKSRLQAVVLAVIERIANLISFGRLTVACSECVYLLEKTKVSQQLSDTDQHAVGRLGRATA